MPRKNIKKTLLKQKNKKKQVNVNDYEENVNEEIILQNDKYDNNIDLDEVHQTE